MRMRSVSYALLLAACWPSVSYAAERRAEGRAILLKHCARCHAIEVAGQTIDAKLKQKMTTTGEVTDKNPVKV